MVSRIYLGETEGRLAEAYWRWLLLSRTWNDAERFARELRRPPVQADSPAAKQFIERVTALADSVRAIDAGEREMNELLFRLYKLTPDERFLVENDSSRRKAR